MRRLYEALDAGERRAWVDWEGIPPTADWLEVFAAIQSAVVMLTGNPDLRLAAVDLYRARLDEKGCAFKASTNGPTLDSSCEIVRRHMCAASQDAASTQRAQGRVDLAQGLDALAAREFRCAPAQ